MGSRGLAIAIAGAGPAGFYTCGRLLRNLPRGPHSIALIEQYPAPFGLLRYGVAPDHPEVRAPIAKFSAMMRDNASLVSYFGNVRVGRDVRVHELRRMFDVVVLCTGAGKSRVPQGLESPPANVFTADSIVKWYNGTPDSTQHPAPDLKSGKHAVVIGNGNVALDAARLLLMSGRTSMLDGLPGSDVSPLALNALHQSSIRHVRIVGRRSVLQSSFTVKELREILSMGHVRVNFDRELIDAAAKEHSNSRTVRRAIQLFQEYKPPVTPVSHTCTFEFLKTVSKAHSLVDNAVSHLDFYPSPYDMNGDPLSSPPERKLHRLDTSLVISACGWHPACPDDEIQMTNTSILNVEGRVSEKIYAAGWAQSGAVGALNSTLNSANSTADLIVKDWNDNDNPEATGAALLKKLLDSRNHEYIDWNGWNKIANHELKTQKRVFDWQELLKIAKQES